MGQRTPNMSIYVPQSGEDLYNRSFGQGMNNVDAHDHSGAPDNGVQIGTNGIQDGAITPDKLSNQIIIVDTTQTLNATPKVISSVIVPESSDVTITGRFIGLTSAATASVGGDFMAVFHRPTAGDVAIVSTEVVTVKHNFGVGVPSFTLVADIGSESALLEVVGTAATTINWKVAYNILTMP